MRHLLAACLVLAADRTAAADDYPKVELKTDGLKLTVYLPDAEKGFYRGTRFDWSGVMGHLEVHGHELFTPWKDTHDPANNDDILGPVEEFGNASPLGYDEAKVGETFLKIGVGELEKPKEAKYDFFRKYKIAKPGTWRVTRDGESGVAFTQDMKTDRGYGYHYVKRVLVQPGTGGRAALVIDHTLRNTGEKAIVTDVYNHNFFNVDRDPVGPNYRFEFPFPVTADKPRERFAEVVAIDGQQLRFTKPLDKGSVFTGLTGFKPDTPAGFTFRHAKSGLTVEATGTARLSKMNFWGVSTTICPEPYHPLELKPGVEARWVWRYEFRKEK